MKDERTGRTQQKSTLRKGVLLMFTTTRVNWTQDSLRSERIVNTTLKRKHYTIKVTDPSP